MPIEKIKDKLIISECRKMIDYLEDFEEQMSDWEENFLISMAEQLESNNGISTNQYDKLKQIYQKY